MEDPADYSLSSLAGILLPCLSAAGARSVIEVGAFRGEFTEELLDWARGAEARVWAVDTVLGPELDELARRRPELELAIEPSHEALRRLPPADAVILDGDHNHFTVTGELAEIERRAEGAMPLVAFHDVCWPHARRDSYYEPDRIPPAGRRPLAEDAVLAPGVPGTARDGLRFPWAAAREGGEANGVLTAIEDFVETRPGLRLAIVPAFFGVGVLWPADAPWADSVERLLAPWDRDPMLARLEAERVGRIVDRARAERYRELLASLLGSRAFTLAERISRVWQRGDPAVSRERVKRALEDPPELHPPGARPPQRPADS